MNMIDSRTRIEKLTRDECVSLLATEEVGRIGVVVAQHPHVIPVNYVLDGEAIVFRTDVGTKLDGMTRSPIAFEVDHFDRRERRGWSVVVHGWAHEVTTLDAPDLLGRVAGLPLDTWAPGERPYLVRLAPLSITGRRVG